MSELLGTSCGTIISWLLVLIMIFVGTLICLSLSFGVAVIFSG